MFRSTLRFASAAALSIALLSGGCQKEKATKDKDSTTEPTDTPGASKTGASKTGAHNKLTPTAKVEVPAPPDVAAPPADAKKTTSGLAYKVLKAADQAGAQPGANDSVTVNYTGWTTDGKMFDTSKKRKAPAQFGVGKVIPGWTEGLQLMRVGESWRFWIPKEIAYNGKPGRPAGMLVFDVELLEIKAAPKVPEDVAKPPKNAKKTAKGVFYKVLTAGQSEERPNPWDSVNVNYSGWTTDGKMFDSSITRGKPATFGVSGVIAGWTDALIMMNKGDKWRVWIPSKLAYDGQPGRPQGMLVFDVELLEIDRKPAPPPVPKHVTAPPKGAKKTASGVFYKILEAKTGGKKPIASSEVKVHYSGWTTDGKMFDSSVTRGAPVSFPLSRVVPGWRDGLMEMQVGEKARLWIPGKLAYDGQKGRPQGMLVFDIELIEIVK